MAKQDRHRLTYQRYQSCGGRGAAAKEERARKAAGSVVAADWSGEGVVVSDAEIAETRASVEDAVRS